MQSDFGVLLMSILWPLMLLACLVMAILLLGLLFGWPLMWPTVSVEGTDSFDALSRSYSYTFQRPLYYLFYGAVAGAIGLLAAYIVAYFVHWTNDLALWSATWGSRRRRINEIGHAVNHTVRVNGEVPEETSWSLTAGGNVLSFWSGCVALVGTAYLSSYFWTAATAIYYLLRHNVDGTESDEVSVEQEDETFGLPPLKNRLVRRACKSTTPEAERPVTPVRPSLPGSAWERLPARLRLIVMALDVACRQRHAAFPRVGIVSVAARRDVEAEPREQ